jgi:hypothetical protein
VVEVVEEELWIGHGDVNGVNVFHDNNPGRPNLGTSWSSRPTCGVPPSRPSTDGLPRTAAGCSGCMGKAADWIDYSGHGVGITLMNHPASPPTPFFARDYGTVLSNLTLHEPVEIAAGDTLRQRWRVVVHDGMDPVGI